MTGLFTSAQEFNKARFEKFNASEPRDAQGKWTAGGSSGSSSSATEAHLAAHGAFARIGGYFKQKWDSLTPGQKHAVAKMLVGAGIISAVVVGMRYAPGRTQQALGATNRFMSSPASAYAHAGVNAAGTAGLVSATSPKGRAAWAALLAANHAVRDPHIKAIVQRLWEKYGPKSLSAPSGRIEFAHSRDGLAELVKRYASRPNPGVGLAGIRGKRTTRRGYHVRGQGGAGRAGRAANYNRLGNYVMKTFDVGTPQPYPGANMKSGEPLVRALQSSLDRYHRMGIAVDEHGSVSRLTGSRGSPANITGQAKFNRMITQKNNSDFYKRLYPRSFAPKG